MSFLFVTVVRVMYYTPYKSHIVYLINHSLRTVHFNHYLFECLAVLIRYRLTIVRAWNKLQLKNMCVLCFIELSLSTLSHSYEASLNCLHSFLILYLHFNTSTVQLKLSFLYFLPHSTYSRPCTSTSTHPFVFLLSYSFANDPLSFPYTSSSSSSSTVISPYFSSISLSTSQNILSFS